jgi:hypothetical protein
VPDGRPPFQADDPIALVMKVAEEDAPPVRGLAPEVPRDLELICLKCLSKDAHDRYPTAVALADDLGRFLSGEPVTVRPSGTAERLVKWAMRKPTLAAAYSLGLLTVLLVGFGATAAWLWQRAERNWHDAADARDEVVGQKKQAEGALERERQAKAKEAEARRQAEAERGRAVDARAEVERARSEPAVAHDKLARVEYGRSIQIAYQAWRDNNLVRTLALLDGTRPDLRGWEWRYVHRLCHPELLTLGGHSYNFDSASFSADGSRVVTAGYAATAKVWDAKSGAEVLTLEGHSGFVTSASFSADGWRVVTGSQDGMIRVWDATPVNREFLTRKVSPRLRPTK